MTLISPALFKGNFEDPNVVKKLNNIFIGKRRYTFQLPNPGKSIVLLISGGLDSICLWNILMGRYKLNVYPVHFLKQGNVIDGEERSIRFYSQFYRTLYPKLFHKVEFVYTTPSLPLPVSRDLKSDASVIFRNLVHNKESDKYSLSISFNSINLYNSFFNAFPYLEKLRKTVDKKINTVLVGYIEEDTWFRRNSTLAVLRSVNLSICLMLGDFSWQYTAALEKENKFLLSRKKLMDYALSKKIFLDKTWSCLKNRKIHCGQCGACIMRRFTFKNTGISDITEYQVFSSGFKSQMRKWLFKFDKAIIDVLAKKNKLTQTYINTYRFSLSPQVEYEEINNRIYLFHKEKGEIDILNESASFIWKHIAEKKQDFSSLLWILRKRYKVNNDRLKKDLTLFLKKYIFDDYLIFEQKQLI